MNTPVNFSIAKLLKEKGFEQKVRGRYTLTNWNIAFKIGEFFVSDYEINDSCIYAPTISEVVMWLYEKHVIWIVVNPHKGEDDLGKPFMEFDPEVWSFTNKCILHNTKLLYFNSPIEAYEAAIEYTLKNLL